MVDVSILSTANCLLSDQKRQELAEESSGQVDIDANSTKKSRVYNFGYKGHIRVNIEFKLIRKVTFTLASSHDSTQPEQSVSYDLKALFDDKAFFNGDHSTAKVELYC